MGPTNDLINDNKCKGKSEYLAVSAFISSEAFRIIE